MKKPKTTRRLLLLTAIAVASASPQRLLANTDLYWDADADATAATGGAGIWSLAGALWRTDTSDGPLHAYDNSNPNGATAHFGGTAGTVTLDAGATINSNFLAFEADGYTLAGGTGSTLNLSGDFPGISGTGTTTISTKIIGTSGFTQSGGSFTILSGDLTGLSGTVEVATRLNLNGTTVTGSQNQAYDVTGILSSENHGTTSTVQLGSLSGSGTLRIGNNGTGTIDSGTDTFQVGALNTDTEFTGTIVNHGNAVTAIKKVGTGDLTLSGANSYTGATTVNAGALTLSGTGTSGAINLAGPATTLNFASTGTVTVPSLSQGAAATDAGIVNHTAGTLTTPGDIALGNAGGYGAYTISGGTLNVNGFRAGSIAGGGNGSGYILQTGGTVNVKLITTLNRSGTGTSVLNIAGDSAVYNQTTNNLNLGYAAGGTGIVTVGAGSLVVNTSIVFGNGASNGILNFNGGSSSTNDIVVLPADGNSTVVNLNGGLLKANVDRPAFMQGLTAANVCSGGARIDTNGKAINISQALLGTLGTTGVTAIPLAAGGSGYLAPPVVAISGGDGTGASAVANVTGGVVTGITITSAGTGYTSPPTVTLTGGGAATPATLGTVAIGANAADGGLTKTGAGTLTLGGDNTYTGPTIVNGGTLQAGVGEDAFGLGSAVTLADADGVTLDLADSNATIGSLIGGGPTGGNVTLGYGILTVANNSATPASFAGSISGNGGLTKTGSGTQILSGNNAYAGNTSIDQGTLQLAAGGQLGFVIDDNFGNQVSGAGALVLNGSFVIDASAVTASTGTWTLIDKSSLSSLTYGASFSPGAGWVVTTPGVWKLNDGAKTWTFTQATGVLSLSTGTANYTTWINGFFPGETNPAIIGAGADPDHDGISNAVEMVIGGNPASVNDAALRPTSEVEVNPAGVPAGSYLVFTYRRTDLSVSSAVTANCEYNAGLTAPWTTAVDGVGGVKILVDDNYGSFSPPATNTDRVRVFIPRGTNATLFSRLNIQTP